MDDLSHIRAIKDHAKCNGCYNNTSTAVSIAKRSHNFFYTGLCTSCVHIHQAVFGKFKLAGGSVKYGPA